MSCATSTIKFLVFAFNIVCALLSITLVVINALALKNADDFIMTGIIFMITLGSVIFLISFFGCFGAIRENSCSLWTYAAFMLVVVMANLTLLLGFSPSVDVGERAQLIVNKAWAQQLNGTDSMSVLQKEFGCCGKNSAKDYIIANLTIPESCYIGGNSTTIATEADLYPDGCLFKLMEYYVSIDQLLSIFSWTTMSVECIALICACILAITFTNQQRRARY